MNDNDLISREAAKAAIRNKFITIPMRCEVNEILNAIPTVDAIPVEWMRDKMRGYASSLKSTETAALVMVMQMWQKEQEGV